VALLKLGHATPSAITAASTRASTVRHRVPFRVPMSPRLEGYTNGDFMYYSDEPRFLIDWSTYVYGPHGTRYIRLTVFADLSDPSKPFSMLTT